MNKDKILSLFHDEDFIAELNDANGIDGIVGAFKNRNIHCFNAPSLQGYTPFAKAMGMESEMGFWLIDIFTDGKGNIHSISQQLYNFQDKKVLKRKR